MRKPIQTIFMLLLTLGLSGLMSACELKLPPMPWDPKPAAEATAGEGEEAAESEEAAEPEKPLDLSVLLPPAMRNLPYQEITIPVKNTGKQRLMLYGRLYDPGQTSEGSEEEEVTPEEETAEGEEEEAYTGPRYPLVILLHGFTHTQAAWDDLPARLVKAGYAVFAMDMRGHGKSTRLKNNTHLNWRFFKKDHWLLVPRDVDQVIRYFTKQKKYPQIDAGRIALIGEKLGATASIIAARGNAQAVKSMVLISPRREDRGLTPAYAIIDYPNAALLITSEDDAALMEDARYLHKWFSGIKDLRTYSGLGNDTGMLTQKPALMDDIRDWLLKTMPATPAPAENAETPASHETPPDKG